MALKSARRQIQRELKLKPERVASSSFPEGRSTQPHQLRAGSEAGRMLKSTTRNGPNPNTEQSANNPENEDADAAGGRKHAATENQSASTTDLPTREKPLGTG